MKFFLDSGAFSAFTKGAKIDVYEYCNFIKKYEDVITYYSVLDDITSAEKTLENQKIMEAEGLEPIPCFHYNEDTKYLEYYLENYNYISLGGMVPVSAKALAPWLDNMFANYICDKDGYPKVKVHGFGLTIAHLMFRYPWYSVDSTSWKRTGIYGHIFIPKFYKGVPNFAIRPTVVAVSSKSPELKKHGAHYETMSLSEKKVVDDYLASIGHKIGKSEIVNGEEVILEEGVSNSYSMRDEVNALYFVKLQKEFDDYPRQFKQTIKKGGLFT